MMFSWRCAGLPKLSHCVQSDMNTARYLSAVLCSCRGPKVDFTKAIIGHSEANGCAIEYSSCSSVVCSSAMLEIVDGLETTAKVVFLVLIDFF